MNLIEDEVGLIADRAMKKTADKIGREMSYQIMRKTKHPTGKLAASVEVMHIQRWEYWIYPTAVSDKGFPYAAAADTGRRVVKAKGDKPLRFRDNRTGEWVSTWQAASTKGKGARYIRSTYNKFT